MLATEAQTLDEKIISLLSHKPGRTALDLLKSCSSRRRKYTIQAIYKELRKLEALGAVHRLKKRYNLRVAWCKDLLTLAEAAYKSSLNVRILVQNLPRTGEKKSWSFNSLRRLDSFWTELIAALSEKSEARHCYQWIPFPWFHLVNAEEEERFISTVKGGKTKYHIVVGGNSELFRSYEKILPRSHFRVSTECSEFKNSGSVYLNLIGEYVVKITFGKKRTAALESFFAQRTSARESSRKYDVFFLKEPMRLEILHSPAQAEKLLLKFRSVFRSA